jgi:hypothetical protein
MSDTVPPTRFLISKSQGNGTTTVTGLITEGYVPNVGDLITIAGASNPDLQVVSTPITALAINAKSGRGTISFASGNEPPQVPIIQANWQPTWAGCMFSSVPALDDNDVVTFGGFVSPTPSYLNGRSYTVMTIPGGGIPPDLNHAAWDSLTSLTVRHQGDQIGDFFYDPLAHITIGSPLTATPAVAIIQRKPILETVQSGDRSMAVALPDSPEGKSLQGFSVEVYDPDADVDEEWDFESGGVFVQTANVNLDGAFSLVWEGNPESTQLMLAGWGIRSGRKDFQVSANFVRLMWSGPRPGNVAARLLVR